MLGAQGSQGAAELEHWDEECVGAGRPQVSGLGGKCDGGGGG